MISLSSAYFNNHITYVIARVIMKRSAANAFGEQSPIIYLIIYLCTVRSMQYVQPHVQADVPTSLSLLLSLRPLLLLC